MKITALKTNKPHIAAALFIMAAVFCLPLSADSSYTVRKGDTLYSISRKYQLTVGELRVANNFSDKDMLKAGQQIIIPSADISNAAALASTPSPEKSDEKIKTETYTVKKGDTLYGIARKFGMNLAELLSLNNMGNDAVLKYGQKLAVKSAGTPSSQSSADTAGISGSSPAGRKGDSSLVWPVEDPSVTYVTGKVSGVELSAKKNEDVKTVRSGTVMFIGDYRGYGKVVFVESKTGLVYAYSWLGSVNVKKGDYVVYGETVGTAGKNTETGKPHLMFMVFKNGMPMDPAKAPRG